MFETRGTFQQQFKPEGFFQIQFPRREIKLQLFPHLISTPDIYARLFFTLLRHISTLILIDVIFSGNSITAEECQKNDKSANVSRFFLDL